VQLECSAHAGLVGVLSGEGRIAEAAARCEELLRLSRSAGDGLNLVQSLQQTAWVALQQGATDRAAQALTEALPWVRSEAARLLSWGWCGMVGSLAARRGHWAVAVPLRASVVRFHATDGVSPDEDERQSECAEAEMRAARAALGDAAYERAWQVGTGFSEAEVLGCAAAELGLQP
jgi:Tetratricopeptide repeat